MKKYVLIAAAFIFVVAFGGVSIKFLKNRAVKRAPSNSVLGESQTGEETSTTSATSTTSGAVSSGEKVSEKSGNITLSIISPSDGQTFQSPQITVTGKTSPNADVFVNEAETTADSNGSFKVDLNLEQGDNTIAVIANDKSGNYIEKDIMVVFNGTN